MDWYLRTYPDVAQAGIDPLDHYVTHGAAEGRDPGPLFNTRWYLETYPDVAGAGVNPLEHYMTYGAAEGRDPGPLFSTRWYLEAYPDVAKAGLNPLQHYMDHGAAEGRRPLPPPKPSFAALFDVDWYLRTYPDVAQAGIDPLEHYVTHGAAEGRDPGPLFSTRWYLETYPDVAGAGINPLEHYLLHGAAEGRDPGPLFSTLGYLNANADVAAARLNPLEHYMSYGAAEGRRLVSAATMLQDRLRRPGSEALSAARELIEAFASSEFDLARLSAVALEDLPVMVDLPAALTVGWRRLYLSLNHVPRALVVVRSIDDRHLHRHLACISRHAVHSKSDLLIVAADEVSASTGTSLPRGVEWRSLAEFTADLDRDQRIQIVKALIHHLRPQSVLVLDSEIGWEVLARYGSRMRRYAGLFGAFTRQSGADGPLSQDYELRYLRRCVPYLAGVYGEDQDWLAQVCRRYGLPEVLHRKFRLLPSGTSDEEWIAALSQDPGFLSRKRAVVA
ncbi:hypothetical protein ACFOD4_03810 [Pseudoroseomonas globiformis]|uniref:Uncharacterized protein n=1 Tax=Teichococcus globiformis TaxID=2307229 RepID=A0ABV7FYD1_9PROT